MPDITVKSVEELSYYQGEKARPDMRFKFAAKDLGVKSFGMNVIEIQPGCDTYPEHDHIKNGQEEIYVVLRGSASLAMPGESPVALATGAMVRVGPAQRRKLLPGPDGATVLALGGTPGQAYKPRE